MKVGNIFYQESYSFDHFKKLVQLALNFVEEEKICWELKLLISLNL